MLKIHCNRQSFYTAITHVAKGVSQKSTIPALERLKLRLDHDNLELTGYDLEFGIQRSIDVESDDVGEFVILPRLLSEAVRRFSGDTVTMEVDDNYLVRLFSEETQFQISAMSAEEYPTLPSLDLNAGMQIEQPVLSSMIRQTSYAASVSEAKPVLTGELFEVTSDSLCVAAIDGYRLAVRQEPISSAEAYRFVVPKRTLLEVANMLRDEADELCTISADRRYVVFEFNGYTVFSRLLEGEFHNYRSSIPTAFETEITMDTSELTRCLERCSLLISGNIMRRCAASSPAAFWKCGARRASARSTTGSRRRSAGRMSPSALTTASCWRPCVLPTATRSAFSSPAETVWQSWCRRRARALFSC